MWKTRRKEKGDNVSLSKLDHPSSSITPARFFEIASDSGYPNLDALQEDFAGGVNTHAFASILGWSESDIKASFKAIYETREKWQPKNARQWLKSLSEEKASLTSTVKDNGKPKIPEWREYKNQANYPCRYRHNKPYGIDPYTVCDNAEGYGWEEFKNVAREDLPMYDYETGEKL